MMYVLGWYIGLGMYHTSPIHQPSTYIIPVQFNTPVYVLCCMYSTGMLYEWGGKGVGHSPYTFIKEGGGGEEY